MIILSRVDTFILLLDKFYAIIFDTCHTVYVREKVAGKN